jgi:hypothetical protein
MSNEKNQEGAEQSNASIARHGDEAQRVLRKLADDVGQHKDLSASRKQAIGSLVDNLDQQIALSKSAAHETLMSARGQLRDGIDKIQTELNNALAEVESAAGHLLRSSMLAWTQAMDKLDGELAAAAKRGASSKTDRR